MPICIRELHHLRGQLQANPAAKRHEARGGVCAVDESQLQSGTKHFKLGADNFKIIRAKHNDRVLAGHTTYHTNEPPEQLRSAGGQIRMAHTTQSDTSHSRLPAPDCALRSDRVTAARQTVTEIVSSAAHGHTPRKYVTNGSGRHTAERLLTRQMLLGSKWRCCHETFAPVDLSCTDAPRSRHTDRIRPICPVEWGDRGMLLRIARRQPGKAARGGTAVMNASPVANAAVDDGAAGNPGDRRAQPGTGRAIPCAAGRRRPLCRRKCRCPPPNPP